MIASCLTVKNALALLCFLRTFSFSFTVLSHCIFRGTSVSSAGGYRQHVLGTDTPLAQNLGSENYGDSKVSDSDKTIYSAAALYDLAVGYRNYEEEVKFLLDAHKRFSGTNENPKKILEVASGPARHSISAINSNSIENALALDLSPEMVEYGMGVAENELGNNISRFGFVCDDMRSFTVDNGPYDSAWILLGSLQHLTTNQDVISCFAAIYRSMKPEGTLILELPHPNELFEMVDSTENSWEIPLEDEDGGKYGELAVTWGADGDHFDPIKQVRQNTVILELKGVPEGEEQNIRDILPLRLFTAQEIDLLSECSGFEVAAMYGALSDEVDVADEDVAYRLVCILRKSSKQSTI